MSQVFFTDRDLGKRFPDLLRGAGFEVERHADHFAPDCPDTDWLREVGARGWAAITHDRQIRYKPNERAAVMAHGVALLVVIGAVPYPQLAASFIATRGRILKFIAEHAPPYIAKVYRPTPAELAKNPDAAGRVERWFP